jgi:hypothetical protein
MQEALTRAFGVERLQTVLNGDDAMALGAAIRAAALNGQVGLGEPQRSSVARRSHLARLMCLAFRRMSSFHATAS